MNLSYRNHKNAEAISRLWNKPLDKADWFKVQAAADGESEILIYDYVGWPFNDPRDLISALAGMDSVTVRLNSPGGDVFDGTAIYNALKSHKGAVTTRIEGLAASMASVIAMAGGKVQAYDNAMLMIHNAWVYSAGNQYDLREIADILEKIDGNILNAYYEKSKVGKRELTDMMKAETWFTAKQAKEKGFIDSIVDGKSVKAAFDLSIFANCPDCFRADKDHELTERDAEKALRDAGFSRNKAKALLARGKESEGDADIDEVAAQIKKITSIIGG
jgi:ATP-dependent protease ClpP protease subunit